jgi:rubredoxin
MPDVGSLDELIARMSTEDAASYFVLRQQQAELLTAKAEIRAGLMELARTYGVPRLDGIQSPSNAALQDSHETQGFNLTSWWAAVPPSWRCPCCDRDKSQLARRDSSGRLLGRLTSHHDHFMDLLDNIVAERAKVIGVIMLDEAGKRFIRRFREAMVRFDDVIVCEDCNNADGRAKKFVDAPAYLTFSPREIADFIIVKPNSIHDLDHNRVMAMYAVAQRHYDIRLRSAESLADRVLRGTHWFENPDFDHLSNTIDQRAGAQFIAFGLDAGGVPLHAVTELLLERAVPQNGHQTWRMRHRRAAPQPPTSNEVALVAASSAKDWGRVPEDWQCEGCSRTKIEIIRPTKKFNWHFLIDEVQFSDGSMITCEACRQAIRDFRQEAREVFGLGEGQGALLSRGEFRGLIRPQPHGLHNIDNEEVARLMAVLGCRFLS